MAGDTPTPMYDNKQGTRLENGVAFDLHLAGETLIPYETVNERRRVNEAFMSVAAKAEKTPEESIESKFPPERVIDLAPIGKQLIAARIYRMEPGEAIEKWDAAA